MPKQKRFREPNPFELFNAPGVVVNLLNDKTPVLALEREELRIWVDLYLGSNVDRRGRILRPNVGKMRADLGRRDPVRRNLLDAPLPCVLMPTTRGRMWAMPQIAPSKDPSVNALNLFRQLLLHPNCESVCGPCANPECKKYFLRQGTYPTKYCSPACGSNRTAKYVTEKKRAFNSAEMLRLSREALAIYVRLKPKDQTWEEFALAHLGKHGHQRQAKSLHRWVNDEKKKAGQGLKLPAGIESLSTKTTKKGRIRNAKAS